MIKLATAKEMQQIDKVTIEKYGIAGIVLMERAGRAVVSKINELFPEPRTQNTLQTTGGQAEHRLQHTEHRKRQD